MRDDKVPGSEQQSSKKSRGSRRWLWLLPLLLLPLLALLYFANRDKGNDTAANNTGAAQTDDNDITNNQPGQQPAGTVSDIATLLNVSDPGSVVGKKVSVSNATVNSVIADRAFTVGTADEYVYAFLKEQLDNGGVEQAVQVRAGETRSIQCTVTKVPDDMTTLARDFELSEQQANQLKQQGFYISVDETTAANGSTTNGSNTTTNESGT